ncbi:MAG: hypothetical protein K6G36_03530 [Candidatus Saccharibacteria bacterium]|nr:hypothetical protein [Candidatus Saccharibacteria bacterium]
MAFKTSGSNALKGDAPKVEAKGGKVLSTSSDPSKIRINISTEAGSSNSSFKVDSSNVTKVSSSQSNLQVENGGKSASAPKNASFSAPSAPRDASLAGSKDDTEPTGGFYHPEDDSDNAPEDDQAADDKSSDQAAEQSGDQAGDQTGNQTDEQAGGQFGDQTGEENPEEDAEKEGDKKDENQEGEDNPGGANPNGAENPDDAENPYGSENSDDAENPEGAKEGEGGDNSAEEAAAGVAAVGGAAAVGAEVADEGLTQQPQNQEDLGDSGTMAAAGTNPALNEEANPSRDAAKNDLRNSEKAAASDAPKNSSNPDKDAKDKENNPAGFKNSTLGKANEMKDKIDPRKRMIKKLKQMGPIGAIIGIILGVGFGLMGMQSFLPFSISELLRTGNDSMLSPVNLRAQRIFLKQLAKPSSDAGDDYDVSNRQRDNLAKNGIYVVDSEDGKRVALFDDGSGKLKVVGGDDASVTALKGKLDSANLSEQLRTKYGKSGFDIDTENIDTYKNRMSNDSDFEMKFKKGSRIWGSSVAAWYDKMTERFSSLYSISRNLFKKFKNRLLGSDSDADSDGTTAKNRSFSDILEESQDAQRKRSGGEVDIDERKFEDQEDDGNGGKRQKAEAERLENDKTKVGFGGDDSDGAVGKTAAVNKAKSSVGKIAKAATSRVTSGACMLLNFVGSATLIASAYNITQILPVVTSFLEAVDKVKSGNSNSPINEIATALVIAVPIVYLVSRGNYTDNVDDITDDNLGTATTAEKNALQSNALSSLLSGTKMNPSDTVTSSFNVGNLAANVDGGGFLGNLANLSADLSMSVGMFKSCSMVKLAMNAGAVIGAVLGFLAGGGIGSALGAAAGNALFKTIESVGKALIATGVTSLVSKLLVPRLATMFMRQLPDLLRGENYGAALVAGAAIYLGRNHLFGGGSPGSREQYIAFTTQQKEQLAKEAEYERANRSPFDYTSQYTFAGSMLRQFAILNTMSSAPTNVLSTIGTLTKNSIISMVPTAAAANDIASTMMTEEEFEATCPSLASIGAYGDIFCNPYVISDLSTIDIDPDEVKNTVASYDNFDDSGEIKDNSDLKKYINYCSGRSSNFGVIDGNIANQVSSTGSTGNAYGDALVGLIPIYGDMLDVITEEKKLENVGWITGENCVANSNNDSGWNTDIKYYQRYVEDERLKESIYGSTDGGDTGYVSPVTAYLDKYYTENPVDNSAEGVLARLSGLTKDQVIATLDYMDYLNFVADYDAGERYAFGEEDIKLPSDIYFEIQDSGTIFATNVLTEVTYADVRNRIATTA